MAKILIIEDDPNVAGVVARHLTAAGHQCVVESSGNQALELARRESVDLFIVDVMLPGLSGFEICRRIRSDSELYTTPVLILSAMRGEEEVMHGLAQGADDYMPKPFEVGQLVQHVEALLRVVGNNVSDRLTGLPGVDAIRREIQRRISLREVFGFAYVELLHARQFGFKWGAEARDKAIRHLARGLTATAEAVAPDAHFIGHMGNGHFVCLMAPECAQDYCRRAYKLWVAHREKFYMSANLEVAYRSAIGAEAGVRAHVVPLLDVLCCITVYDRKHDATPQKLFEVLSQIRHKALASKAAGVFIDQRT